MRKKKLSLVRRVSCNRVYEKETSSKLSERKIVLIDHGSTAQKTSLYYSPEIYNERQESVNKERIIDQSYYDKILKKNLRSRLGRSVSLPTIFEPVWYLGQS